VRAENLIRDCDAAQHVLQQRSGMPVPGRRVQWRSQGWSCERERSVPCLDDGDAEQRHRDRAAGIGYHHDCPAIPAIGNRAAGKQGHCQRRAFSEADKPGVRMYGHVAEHQQLSVLRLIPAEHQDSQDKKSSA
jgi:hypothetical protein